MAPQENEKIFIGPDEGTRLSALGITHKVTAESFDGALAIIEGRIPPGEMVPRTPTPAKTSAPSCWKVS